MLERADRVLKIVCVALGLLLFAQLVRVAVRSSPLAHVKIPALPSLPPEPGTQPGAIGTNRPSLPSPAKPGTNAPSPGAPLTGTNPVIAASNSSPREPSGSVGTNSAQPPEMTKARTNTAPQPSQAGTATGSSGRGPGGGPGRGSVPPPDAGGPGMMASAPPGMPMMGMNPGMPGGRPTVLPPAVQARVDKITESELLAPVVRPLPMALLGIAGKDVFLRAPNGQTGLVKEGDELGAVKVLRVGTNRVLVEQDGQKKELTIFSGYGGESLLPPSTEKPQ